MFHHLLYFVLILGLYTSAFSQAVLPQQPNLVLGARDVLVIRGVDPATHTWQNTDDDLVVFETELNAYTLSASFNQAWIGDFDITPVYNFTVSGDNSIGFLANTFDQLAANDGYNLMEYNVIVYLHQSSIDFGGAGALGSGNGLVGSLYANNNLTWFEPGLIHEVFHAFGVGHAETIEGGDAVYPGMVTGGHDPYHFMGSEGDASLMADVPAYMKYLIGWISAPQVVYQDTDVSSCVTHRIYKYSKVSSYDITRNYAIQLGSNLWVSYEPSSENSNIAITGTLLHYIPSPGSAVTRLLDTRPNSIVDLPDGIGSNYLPVIDFWDAAMEVGNSQIWEGIEISILNSGGSGDERWVDVEFCDCVMISGDTDGDGVCDSHDVCDTGDDTMDLDGDLIPDACDICPLDGSNDANQNGICDNEECLIAVREDFDYPAGSDLETQSSISGMSQWVVSDMNGSVTIESGSIMYPALATSGNRVRFELVNEDATKSMFADLVTPIVNGQTFWVTFVVKPIAIADGGFWLRPNNNQAVAIGKKWGNEVGVDNGTQIPYSLVNGQEHRFVARYQLKPTETIIHLWIDRIDNFADDNANGYGTAGVIQSIDNFSIAIERWGDGIYEFDGLEFNCTNCEETFTITNPVENVNHHAENTIDLAAPVSGVYSSFKAGQCINLNSGAHISESSTTILAIEGCILD